MHKAILEKKGELLMKSKYLLTAKNIFKGSFLPYTSLKNRRWEMVTKDVWVYTNRIVNICLIKNENGELIMVDAGMPKDYKVIMRDINEKFNGQKPVAIILTHGHFDHVGSLAHILTEWNIPVFSSLEEIPFLIGKKDYPKGKYSRNGLVAMLSRTFPNQGIDLKHHIIPLSDDHSIPYLNEWEWIATPGHTPGHISLYHKKDRILIAGDAIVTVKQESLLAVITQKYSFNGPPAYFTPNKEEAKKSLVKLLQIPINDCVTGHGPVIRGKKFIEDELKNLVKKYDIMEEKNQNR